MKPKKLITSILLLTLLTAALSFIPSPQKENEYIIPERKIVDLYNAIQFTKQVLPVSNYPANQVNQTLAVLDSIQIIIKEQYQIFHPDTTKKKK